MQKKIEKYDINLSEKEREKAERDYLKKKLIELGFEYVDLLEYDSKKPEINKEYHEEVRAFLRELKKLIESCKISDTKQKYKEMFNKKYILNTVYEYLLEMYDQKLISNTSYFDYFDYFEINKIRNYNGEDLLKKEKIDLIRNVFLRLQYENIDSYIKERLRIELVTFFLKQISSELYNISLVERNKLKQVYEEIYEGLKKKYSEASIKEVRIKNRLSIEKEFSLFLLQKIRERSNFYKNAFRLKEVYRKQPTQEELNIYRKILKKEKITNSEIKTILLYIREDTEKSEIYNFQKRVDFIMEFAKEMENFNSGFELNKIEVFKSVYDVLYVEKSCYDRKSNYKLAKEILKNKNLKFVFLNEVKNVNSTEIQKNKSLQNEVTEYAQYLVNEILNSVELYYSTEEELIEIIELDKIKVQVFEYILKLPNKMEMAQELYEVYKKIYYIL